MGEAFTLDLASKGWQVAMVDLKRNEPLEAKLGENGSFHQGDVSDYDSQAKCFQEVWDKYGRLDLLCANAGIIDKRQADTCLDSRSSRSNSMDSSLYILNHKDPDTYDLPPIPDSTQ